MPCGLAVLSIKQHLKKKRFRRVNSARISRSSQNWVNGRHETQDETQQCVIWLGTLGQANAWVFMHCGSFVFVVSLFQSLFFVVSWLSLCFDLITMWLKFVRCSFHRHRHVSCARWVTLFDLFVYFTSHLFHILHPPALLAAFHLLLRWCRDNHAHVRRGVGSRGQDKLLHRSWTQRLLYHGGLCRVHPGVHDWATVPDFDNDDITIGQSLLDACRRRADHSEGECLSSCLSSLVSHDRTEKPVDCRDASHGQGCEIQRHYFKSEQIRTLLDPQWEQILADCQADSTERISSWLWPKKSSENEWNDGVEARTSSCSSRRTTPTRSTTSP